MNKIKKTITNHTFIFILLSIFIFDVENIQSQTSQEVKTWLKSTFEYCQAINSGTLAEKKITDYECNPNSGKAFTSIKGTFDRKEVYYNKFLLYGKNKIEIIHNGPFGSEEIEYIALIQLAIENDGKITLTYSTYPLSMGNDNFTPKSIFLTFSSEGQLQKLKLSTKEIQNKEYSFTTFIKAQELSEINAILKSIPELPLLNKKGKASNGIFGIGAYLRVALIQIGILKPNTGELGKIATGYIKLTNRFPAIWK